MRLITLTTMCSLAFVVFLLHGGVVEIWPVYYSLLDTLRHVMQREGLLRALNLCQLYLCNF